MPIQPKLTICVPSRNRQRYLKKTIEGMARNPRQDLQLVISDNSDDPSEMNAYMETLRDDPRIVYLPSLDHPLSMIENWERTMLAASGEWVTFIGDDDHCEPDVADLIISLQRHVPDMEALSWGTITYSWPVEGEPVGAVHVPLNTIILRFTRKQLQQLMFGWDSATSIPKSGFSVYHSAVSKKLLDKIRTVSGGRYFEHPVVDYDMAMKVINNGSQFVYCGRPFSVQGVCPESNSYAIGRMEDIKKKVAIYEEEIGRSLDQGPYLKDFPFGNMLGVSSAIAIAQQWFKWRFKFQYPNWEKNFVLACAQSVEMFRDRESFDMLREAHLKALRKWHDGRFVKFFNPKFVEVSGYVPSGFTQSGVYIKADTGDAQNPYELFDIVNEMVTPIDLIDVDGQIGATTVTAGQKLITKARSAGSRGRLR